MGLRKILRPMTSTSASMTQMALRGSSIQFRLVPMCKPLPICYRLLLRLSSKIGESANSYPLFEGLSQFPEKIVDDFRLPVYRHILTLQHMISPTMIAIILAIVAGEELS